MATYVVIFTHSVSTCPGADRETFEFVSTQMPKMESIAKDLGVKVEAIHLLLPGHTGVAILDAADYEAASQFVMQLGIDRWNNDLTIKRSHTPQEVIQIGAERHGAG